MNSLCIILIDFIILILCLIHQDYTVYLVLENRKIFFSQYETFILEEIYYTCAIFFYK